MKNKYERLTKEEKKTAKKEYIESDEKNANIYSKVKRLKFLCVLGIVYAVIMFGLDFLYTTSPWDFVLDGILLIFCVVFLLKVNNILSDQINKFLIEKDKPKKKKK